MTEPDFYVRHLRDLALYAGARCSRVIEIWPAGTVVAYDAHDDGDTETVRFANPLNLERNLKDLLDYLGFPYPDRPSPERVEEAKRFFPSFGIAPDRMSAEDRLLLAAVLLP